jgi:hypothetical protein
MRLDLNLRTGFIFKAQAYITILIAGVGGLVRKVILPGNIHAGYVASGILAIILICFLNSMTNKYKGNESYDQK